MERKTAVATAAAITMSVASGLFAVGAGTGAVRVGVGAGTEPAVQSALTRRPHSRPRARRATALGPTVASTFAADIPTTGVARIVEPSPKRGEFDD